MQAFLNAMDLNDVAPVSWTVHRFCSAYYALLEVSDTASMRDRYKQFFRVELTCSRDVGGVPNEPFKTWSCEETDSTWQPPDKGGLFRWSELECIVIADFFDGPPSKALAPGFPQETRTLAAGIHQLRINLGMLRTDGDDSGIKDVIRTLAAEGASMNAQTSEYRWLSAQH